MQAFIDTLYIEPASRTKLADLWRAFKAGLSAGEARRLESHTLRRRDRSEVSGRYGGSRRLRGGRSPAPAKTKSWKVQDGRLRLVPA